MLIAAALFLTGVAPSFADEAVEATEINWEDAPDIMATSAVMIDAGSGTVLYEKNADERRDPASVTKIMTALVVLETMDLDDKVTIEEDADETGNSIDLKAGETLTVEQLLYAMLLHSANDAAEILAEASGGTVENFCDLMNERAKRCGAENTNFTNPNGLNTYGQENHRTTARDLAFISMKAMKNSTFREMVSTRKYTIPANKQSKKRVLHNTNLCFYDKDELPKFEGSDKIEGSYKYKGANGIKTGTTSVAGYCYCGSAKRGDTELIAVILNSTTGEERFRDAIKLWDYGFSKYETYVAAVAGKAVEEVKVRRGAKNSVGATVAEDMDITMSSSYDKKSIRTVTDFNEDITAPVKKGDKLGTITVKNGEGQVIGREDLIALSTVEKGGPLSYIGIADEDLPLFFVGLASVIALLILLRMLYVQMKRRKKKRRRARLQRDVRRKEWEKEKEPFKRK